MAFSINNKLGMHNRNTSIIQRQILFIFSLLLTFVTQARIVYVKPLPSGDSSGTSWNNAANLSEALINAQAGDSLWVAAGIYKPVYDPFGNAAPANNRDKTFFIKDNVNLFGGFTGYENLFSQRNFTLNRSVLSGDIGNLNDSTDNAYHVVLSAMRPDTNSSVTIDGFTIRGGNANGSGSISKESGLILIKRDYGAGLSLYGGKQNIIANNDLASNYAKTDAGAIYLELGVNTLTNNIISNNQAQYGAGISINSSYLRSVLVNNIFIRNRGTYGGACYIYDGANIFFSNNTFLDNTASSYAGAIYISSAVPTFSNNLFWNNKLNGRSDRVNADIYQTPGYYPYYYNNIFQLKATSYNFGPSSKGNQFNIYPDFTDTNNIAGTDGVMPSSDDGLTLKKTSPGIDAGNIAYLPAGILTDVLSNPRSQLNTIDIGAYEFVCGPGDSVIASINITTSTNPACSSQVAQFNVSTLYAGTSPQYQWIKNGVNIPDADSSIYMPVAGADFNDADTIQCMLTSSRGCLKQNPVISNGINMQVIPSKTRLYVNANATGLNNGNDWVNAFTDLQSALAYQGCLIKETEIWVAAGTYKPSANASGMTNPTDSRTKTFLIKDGLKLYGGFSGTETTIDQRNWKTNITILSGDIGNINDSTDNTYHVVLAPTPSKGTGVTIDGFTITKGRANALTSTSINANVVENNCGAGICLFNGNNIIKNNLITENSGTYGAGIYAYLGTNNISNNIIRLNKSLSDGGGVYMNGNNNVFTHNFFLYNTSGNQSGGGAYINTRSTLNNNVFAFNTGVGMSISGTGSMVSHNTFFANSGNNTGGLSTGTNIQVVNNTFLSNKKGTSTTVQGADYIGKATLKGNALQLNRSSYTSTGSGTYDLGMANSHNLFAINPLLADTTNLAGPDGIYGTPDDGLQLSSISPCIDATDSTWLSVVSATDIAAQPRRKNTPDIGAYEFQCANASLQVTPSIFLQNSSGSSALCFGDTLKLAVKNNYSSFYDAYQWTKNGHAIPGADTSFYNGIAGTDFIDSDTINCIITSNRSCVTNNILQSDSLVVTVINPTTRLYVNANATGANTGLSWTDAYTDLQSALSYGGCKIKGREIWVAAGTYKPTADPFGNNTPANLRDKTFFISDSVRISGGFSGHETAISQRNITANPTILSGDIGTLNDSTDNCYHVILALNENQYNGFFIDGVIIKEGNANTNTSLTIKSKSISRNNGGGILAYQMNCEIINSTIVRNNGGGIVVQFGNTKLNKNTFTLNRGSGVVCLNNLTATNNIFIRNQGGSGGAVNFTGGSNCIINANTFIENECIASGSALYIQSGLASIIVSNVFANNKTAGGGTIYASNGTQTILNNTLFNNTGLMGAGMVLSGTSNLRNNIFSNNKTTGSLGAVQDIYFGSSGSRSLRNNVLQSPRSAYSISNTGNEGIGESAAGNLFQVDPLFLDTLNLAGADSIYGTSDDGLNVNRLSPCIDAGDTSQTQSLITDISGANRFQKTIDIGAFESSCDSINPLIQATANISIINGTNPSCSGKTTLFYLDYTYGGINPTIQWTKNGSPIPGATLVSYSGISGTDFSNHDSIGCIFTSTRDCLPAQVIHSNSLLMVVNQSLSRIYVSDSATGKNDGSSWADAFTSLQNALEYSGCQPDSAIEVWVRKGVYTPVKDPFANAAPVDNRDKAFFIKDRFKLYGGFAGNETTLDQRNVKVNETILSGDIGIVNDSTDNCYHVIIASCPVTGKGITVDGFTITTANANGAGSITVNGNVISRNSGGGIIAFNGTNTIRNNFVVLNSASNNGAGVITYSGNNTISYNFIVNNTAANGGGLYIPSGTAEIANNLVYLNTATLYGGGIYLSGTCSLVNNTIYHNTASNAGGLYTAGGTNAVNNNIFWNNTLNNNAFVAGADYYRISGSNTFNHNLLQLPLTNYAIGTSGNYALGTNAVNNLFNISPEFTDSLPAGPDGKYGTTDDGLKLRNSSPCIDIGNKTYLSAGNTSDISGLPRVNMSNIDMGAYEFVCDSSTMLTPSTSIEVINGNNPSCSGRTLKLKATGVYSGFNPTYSWQKNGAYISGATSSEYSVVAGTNFVDGDELKCIITSNRGCLANTVSSARLTMRIYGNKIYVKANATGANTGLSWNDAFTNLQDALKNTCSDTSTQIWVAGGTYIPTQIMPGYTDPRLKMFVVNDGMKIYGGFAGNETTLEQRDYRNNPTILTGDIGTPGDSTDNSYHVVLLTAPASGAKGSVLDGFTITKGLANVYNSITSNGTVSSFSGAGIYIKNGTAIIRNCIIQSNTAIDNGGGLFSEAQTLTVANNIIRTNYSSRGAGAYMSTSNSSVTFTNNLFVFNNASGFGGGLFLSGTSGTLLNNTLYSNSAASDGGGIYTQSGTYNITHNIFWKNSRSNEESDYKKVSGNNTFKNNLLQRPSTDYTVSHVGNLSIGPAASGNLFAVNPQFADSNNIAGPDNIYGTDDDGLRLKTSSPCIDMGDSTLLPKLITDIKGSRRPLFLNTDMGAYEFGCTTLDSMVSPLITMHISAGENPSCYAKSVTFTVNRLLNGGTSPAIQWFRNNAPVPGATLSSWTAVSGTDFNHLDSIAVRLTSNAACIATSVSSSNSISMTTPATVNRMYVNVNANGLNNGTSWSNAFTDLQSALSYPCIDSTTEVWVAAGTYKPTHDPSGNRNPVQNRNKTFYIKDGLKVYGGFTGLETSLTERSPKDNITILSGDIGTINNNSDNCYHVVLAVAPVSGGGITLDGFTITDGNAWFDNSLTVNTSTILTEHGGGIYLKRGQNNIENNIIISNNARLYGGGIYGDSCNNQIRKNFVLKNNAQNGGGLYSNTSRFNSINNNVFAHNYGSTASGINLSSPNPNERTNIISNNTFFANISGDYVLLAPGSIISNNILWKNRPESNWATNWKDISSFSESSFSNNLIQLNPDQYSYRLNATNLFNANPNFLDTGSIAGTDGKYGTRDDGLQLLGSSVCINKGDSILTNNRIKDLAGNNRINGRNIDLGAYEFYCTESVTTPLHAARELVLNSSLVATLNINVTKGSGNKRLILVKAGDEIDLSSIKDTSRFTAHYILELASRIDGASIVYNDTGTSVLVSGLLPSILYYVAVIEYNESPFCDVVRYNTSDYLKGTFLAKGNQYRSAGNVSLTEPENWEKSTDYGLTWFQSYAPPSPYFDDDIIIRAPDVAVYDSAYLLFDGLIIEKGATLQINNNRRLFLMDPSEQAPLIVYGTLNMLANASIAGGRMLLQDSATLALWDSQGFQRLDSGLTKVLSPLANYTFNGPLPQTINPPAGWIMNNLTINTGAAVTINGNATVNGTLSLAGSLYAANKLTLNPSASLIYDNNGFITGFTLPAQLKNYKPKPNTTNNLSANLTLSGYLDIGTRTFNKAAYDLTLGGDLIHTTGKIQSNGGTLKINGLSQNTTLSFTTSSRLENLVIERPSSTISLNDSIRITGSVTPLNGNLNTNNKLILLSDSVKTGRITAIGSTADVTGNVTVQRFLKGGSINQRGWRNMSSPVGYFNYQQFTDDIFMTGPGGISNGFDASAATSSVLHYQESTTGGRGLKDIASPTATLDAGQGNLTYFMGRRTQTAALTDPTVVPAHTTLDFYGPINKGNTGPLNLSYTSTPDYAEDGWNLLGNPYPCEIDYSLVSKSASVSNSYWIINPVTQNYENRTANDYIASSQGFFVKADAAAQWVSFAEDDKTNGSHVAYFKSATEPFAVKMNKDSFVYDIAWLQFNANAGKNYIFNEDAVKLRNPEINMGFKTSDQVTVQRNTVSTLVSNSTDTFAISTQSVVDGNYWLSFEQLDYLPAGKNAFLFDLYNNNWINIRNTRTYQFTITNAVPSSTGNRFLFILSDVYPSLPVKLVGFTAKRNRNTDNITWHTQNEKNISSYEIQQSPDGIQFNSIGLVKARNNTVNTSYEITTTAAKQAVTYYRLKINEHNGTAHYSTIISIHEPADLNTLLSVYPNPASDRVNIEATDLIIEKVSMIDASGRSINITLEGKQVNMLGLEIGVYLLEIKTNIGTKVIKVVKQ